MLRPTTLERLREIIQQRVIIHQTSEIPLVGKTGSTMDWIFDFRSILLDAEFLTLIAELFWEQYAYKYPFQVGGLESASIPMIAAIVLKGKERGTPVAGFYIRKSRKPEGLQKTIEGTMTDDPIILVDDLINGGGTFLKQITILEKEQKRVVGIFAIVRFRNIGQYTFAEEKEIKINAPFSLAEFGLTLPTPRTLPSHTKFKMKWIGQSPHANYFYRIPKSAPVLDREKIYFGSDNGVMRALWQADGTAVWEYKILGLGTSGKTIFSSPAIFNKTIYFGAYDGNFYALDAETGTKKWIYMDADWIGSSPCVAEDLKMVYVGLEYGLWKKQGGIVALDAATGEKKWEYITMPSLTHGSPTYSSKYNMVVIGSNNGTVYAFNATSGALLWTMRTGAEVRASFAIDENRGLLVFGSFDNTLYIVGVKDGKIVWSMPTGAAIYSTPCILEKYAYVSSLDKRVYCINLDTFTLEWKFETSGRIFASPIIADGMLYVGSNDGRLYEFNPSTGENTSFFQTTERITNKIGYNKETGCIFLPTYANELYCLEKNEAL